mmetsp:Transcript_15380/g.22592  ORF Transcript_15380/g.22592 Transcript_15380/m.22592 type:complete len:103 (-) Transcript_15380:982-1290(-)
MRINVTSQTSSSSITCLPYTPRHPLHVLPVDGLLSKRSPGDLLQEHSKEFGKNELSGSLTTRNCVFDGQVERPPPTRDCGVLLSLLTSNYSRQPTACSSLHR